MQDDKAKKLSKTRALRKAGGQYLKRLRQEAGLTQRELAEAIGLEYYTFISQIESGQGRLQPQFYEAAAKALNVTPKEFTKTMLMHYDPSTFNTLFGDEKK